MANIFQRALLAKIETTKGTDAVPAAATDAVRVQTLKVTPNADAIERPVVKNTMGNLPHLIGRKTIEITADVLMRASGTLGTAPDIGAILQACGLSETINAGASVVYQPVSLGLKSISSYAYDDGQLFKALGAVANATIDAQIDSAIKASLTLKAGFETAPTTTAAPTPTYNATAPIVMTQADVITDGGTINVGAFKLDLGNDFGDHSATGLNEFTVANRKPQITITKDSVATIADWNALVVSTAISLSATFGSTAGNKIVIAAANCRMESLATGERNERITRDITFDCYETSGDDQFTITFE